MFVATKLALVGLAFQAMAVAQSNDRLSTRGIPESAKSYSFTVTNESDVALTAFTVAVERHNTGSSVARHIKFFYVNLLHQPALKRGQRATPGTLATTRQRRHR